MPAASSPGTSCPPSNTPLYLPYTFSSYPGRGLQSWNPAKHSLTQEPRSSAQRLVAEWGCFCWFWDWAGGREGKITTTSQTDAEYVKPGGQIAQKGSNFSGFPAVKINHHWKIFKWYRVVKPHNKFLALIPQILPYSSKSAEVTRISQVRNGVQGRDIHYRAFKQWDKAVGILLQCVRGFLPDLFIYLAPGFIGSIGEVEDFNTPIRYKRWRRAKNIPVIGRQEFL